MQCWGALLFRYMCMATAVYLSKFQHAAPDVQARSRRPMPQEPASPPPAAAAPYYSQTSSPVRSPTGGGNNNNYHRAGGQNVGNFITDRSSSRVTHAPGGASQITFG